MKYNVFLCPELRVKYVDIEADSQVEAIKKAEAKFCKCNGVIDNIHSALALTQLRETGVESVELSKDCYHALVDEVEDQEYLNSNWYDIEDKPYWTPRYPEEAK